MYLVKKLALLVLSIFIIGFYPVKSARAESVEFMFFSEKGGTFEFGTVDPGEKLSGSVFLQLADPIESTFKIKFRIDGGSNAIQDAGASWISFPKGEDITLKYPAEKVKVPFRIKIPENTPPGDYIGMLSAVLAPQAASSGGGGGTSAGAGVQIASAIGINVKFSITGDRIIKLKLNTFNIETVPSDEEKSLTRVVLNYQNDGNSLATPKIKIVVNSYLNGVIYDKEHDLSEIYPGENKVHSIILEGVNTDVFLGKFDIMADVYYLDGDGNKFDVSKASFNIVIIPWRELIFGLGAILLLIIVIMFGYYRLKFLRNDSNLYEVRSGDTLQTVCTQFKVDPKKVIKVNKLKSPFFLEAGSKIYIPKK
jgi:hypothetical protein